MTMEIGGCDVYLTHEGTPEVRAKLDARMRQFWPDLCVEDCGEDKFYYRNKKAQASWNLSGLTEENAEDMVYAIFEPMTSLVFDYLSDEVLALLDALRDKDGFQYHVRYEGAARAVASRS